MNIVVYIKLEKDYRAYARVNPLVCEGCGICVKVCPIGVLFLSENKIAEIPSEKCQGCGACASLCKTGSITMDTTLNFGPYESHLKDSIGLRSRLDKNAIEAALSLRDKTGGKVWILAVGPPHAKEAVKEALVMGGDEGVLLCDMKFLGSDHRSSASVLRAALNKMGGCDLLIAPQRTLWGESVLCMGWMADELGMAYMPFVRELAIEGAGLIARRRWGAKWMEIYLPLPAVVTVERDINEPRPLSLMAAARAMGKTVSLWSASDLNLGDAPIGDTASQVHLTGVSPPPRGPGKKRKTTEILKGPPEELARTLFERLKNWNFVKFVIS